MWPGNRVHYAASHGSLGMAVAGPAGLVIGAELTEGQRGGELENL
jgi:hypothetical protein